MALKFSVSLRQLPGTAAGTMKYYPTLQSSERNLLDALVNHITSHNSKFNKADLEGVLTEIVSCMKEMLLDGDIVQLGDDFGSFRLSITSGGMTQEEMEASDGYFDTNLIKSVHVVWNKGRTFRGLKPADFSFTEVTTLKEQETEMSTKRAARAGKVTEADKDTEPGPETGGGTGDDEEPTD